VNAPMQLRRANGKRLESDGRKMTAPSHSGRLRLACNRSSRSLLAFSSLIFAQSPGLLLGGEELTRYRFGTMGVGEQGGGARGDDTPERLRAVKSGQSILTYLG